MLSLNHLSNLDSKPPNKERTRGEEVGCWFYCIYYYAARGMGIAAAGCLAPMNMALRAPHEPECIPLCSLSLRSQLMAIGNQSISNERRLRLPSLQPPDYGWCRARLRSPRKPLYINTRYMRATGRIFCICICMMYLYTYHVSSLRSCIMY
jgi:hypothetical protein